ncbi:nucleotide-binding universal stress UspA family protein [Isoptericola jiangsuensis]|uniref:Nucleotide-binding universal stress UspA family protein n=1 Tax=Isoptericola jiangsuensis TaxID=548579 RepID=A0A2A9EWH2_9MICO|nr:universal stress protein [Isoptericola jiangsuensis]PFG43477.1 nucleotide-binding universal stress UspA family protein [Isoptericola jiangsuensis]
MAIVVGHLSTPEGSEALGAATAEARRRGSELVLVTAAAQDAEAGLTALHERLTAAGVEHRLVPGTGDLADDLVRTATESGAELIVIGLRRRSPVGKLILGSGAQRILLDAPCPVLAVKP